MVEEFIKPVRTIGQDDLGSPDYSLSQTPRELPREDEATTDNTNRHFKGQQRNETVLCFTRKHWIVLVPHFIGFAAFLLAIPAFIVLVPAGPQFFRLDLAGCVSRPALLRAPGRGARPDPL